METKTCAKCGKKYPATSAYFYKHSNYADGLNGMCIKCKRQYDKDYYKKNRGQKKKKSNDYSFQIELDKKAIKGYQKLMNEPREYGVGDKLHMLKFKTGEKYKLEYIVDVANNITETFEGRLIGQTDLLIILKHNTGYKECYRKFDILSGHYKIKEAQN